MTSRINVRKRAAYSDRTAWLLTEISRLAYDPLPDEESSANLVFLSDAPNVVDEKGIRFKDLEVKKSPNIFWRVSIVFFRLLKTRLKATATDHSILDYSQKLLAHAQRRNNPVDPENRPR